MEYSKEEKKIRKIIMHYYKEKSNLKHLFSTIEWFEENELYKPEMYGSLWFQAFLFDTQSILSVLQLTEQKNLYLEYVTNYVDIWKKESAKENAVGEILKDSFEKIIKKSCKMELISSKALQEGKKNILWS